VDRDVRDASQHLERPGEIELREAGKEQEPDLCPPFIHKRRLSGADTQPAVSSVPSECVPGRSRGRDNKNTHRGKAGG
jgi:hypothetical protein